MMTLSELRTEIDRLEQKSRTTKAERGVWPEVFAIQEHMKKFMGEAPIRVLMDGMEEYLGEEVVDAMIYYEILFSKRNDTQKRWDSYGIPNE